MYLIDVFIQLKCIILCIANTYFLQFFKHFFTQPAHMWSAHQGKAQPDFLFQIKSSPAAINHRLADEAHAERTAGILGSSACHLQPQQVWVKPQDKEGFSPRPRSELLWALSPNQMPQRSQNIIYEHLDFSITKLNNTHPKLALSTELSLLLFTIILLITEFSCKLDPLLPSLEFLPFSVSPFHFPLYTHGTYKTWVTPGKFTELWDHLKPHEMTHHHSCSFQQFWKFQQNWALSSFFCK